MSNFNPDEWDGSKPLPVLYARTATGATNVWRCWIEGAYVCVEWGQFDGALQQGRFACAPKNTGRANATTAHEQARLEAISKWKKQLKKKYSMTVEATKEMNFAPMLAKSFEDRKDKITYPVYVQPKFDGVRCMAHRGEDGEVHLMSRGKDPYNVAHVKAALEPLLDDDTVLDGELYIHGMKLQNIVSLVKRPQGASKELLYCVYDVISLRNEQTQSERVNNLDKWFGNASAMLMPKFIQKVQTMNAPNEADVRYYHDEYVKMGYEGAIIRLPEGIYRFGYRSSDLLKLKAFQDDEFEVIGVQPGKGKFANAPIFTCVTRDGKKFDVVPKGTEQERYEMLCRALKLSYHGKFLNVRFFAYTNDGAPQFPVGMYFREEGT
jgi:DNA ligase-1